MKKLLLLCLLLGVSIGAFAQVDTLSPITPPPPPQPVYPGYGADNLFACLPDNLYRCSSRRCGTRRAGAGSWISSFEKRLCALLPISLRRLSAIRSRSVDAGAENRRSPGAQFVGPDAGVGCLFRRSDGRSGQFSEIYLPYAPSRRIEQQVVPVGAYACIFFMCVYYVLYKG